MELIERILNPVNLTKATKHVISNKGSAGVDKLTTEDLKPYLREKRKSIIKQIIENAYYPQPIRGVEIDKGNGKMRLLGICIY